MKMIIADDHPVTRLGLVRSLAALPDLDIVALAGTAEELLDASDRFTPGLILTDLCMPSSGDIDGHGMVQQLVQSLPGARVLVLTAVTHERVLRRLLQMERVSLVLKASGLEEIFRAVDAIREGRCYACPLARQLVDAPAV